MNIDDQIFGDASNLLTDDDLDYLASAPVNSSLILRLLEGLTRKIIDHNKLLWLKIRTINSWTDLAFIGILLRSTKPQIYTPDNKNVLVHAYEECCEHVDPSLFERLFGMIMMANHNIITSSIHATSTTICSEWLDHRSCKWRPFLAEGSENLTFCKMVLDDINHITIDEIGRIDSSIILFSHSHKLLTKLFKYYESDEMVLARPLYHAVQCYNLHGFIIASKLGVRADYIFMNELILELGHLKYSRRYLEFSQVLYMLVESVYYGCQIDLNQISLLRSIDHNAATYLETCNSSNHWKVLHGVCDDYIDYIAYSLSEDIHMDVKEHTKKLTRNGWVHEINTGGLFRKTYEELILTHPNKSRHESTVVHHESIDDRHPFNVNQLAITDYYDDEGYYWSFTANDYRSLIEDGTNPITGMNIPEHLLVELKNKNRCLSSLGMESLRITNEDIVKAARTLKKLEKISNVEIDKEIKRFMLTSQVNGTHPRVFRQMDNHTRQRILQEFNISVNFHFLTEDHGYATFAVAANSLFRHHPHVINEFFRKCAH